MRARSSASIIAVAMLLPACVPPVGHAPRIEPGGRWFLSFGFTHSPELQGEQVGVLPSFFAGGGNGWVTTSGTAVSLGIQIPVLLFPIAALDQDEPFERSLGLILVDVYVQPQRAATPGNHEAGVGVLASTALLMPYVQFGSGKDNGLYTTQGVVVAHGAFNTATYWAPMVAIRDARPDGTRAADFYLSALVGRIETGSTVRTEWMLSAGVIAEIRRKR